MRAVWPVVVALVALGAGGLAPSALAHDVNGDGFDDVVTLGRGKPASQAVVVLGGTGVGPVSRAAPGPRGFVIDTAIGLESAEIAGDMDGDGLAEVVVYGWTRDSRGAGRVYVVWGRREAAPVDLRVASAAVTRVGVGRRQVEGGGPAGDIDGDGLADLAITHVGRWRQRVSVLRGSRDRSGLDLAAASFDVRSASPDLDPESAEAAGDVNGDGIGDLLTRFTVSVYCGEGGDCGTRSVVLFGSAAPADRVIRGRLKRGIVALGAGGAPSGFEIADPWGGSGYTGGPAGDFNGDGLADVTVTGLWSRVDAIVFGRSTTGRVPLPTPPRLPRWREWHDGLGLLHGRSDLRLGELTGAGDVTGDGLSDVVIAEDSGRAVRVVAGRPATGLADLRGPAAGSRLLLPPPRRFVDTFATLDRAVPAGDANGDGHADLLLDAAIPVRGRYETYRRRSFVVLGPITGDRRLTALGTGGFEIR